VPSVTLNLGSPRHLPETGLTSVPLRGVRTVLGDHTLELPSCGDCSVAVLVAVRLKSRGRHVGPRRYAIQGRAVTGLMIESRRITQRRGGVG
jgi:hypothetical protein